ncbi:MAG: co-chaperone GroES [Candidatus Comchoanobacterales bacterium]
MSLRPLEDRVIVKRDSSDEKSSGGIILPDSAKEVPVFGEVIAAGPGKRNQQGDLITMQVSQGDKIVFGKYAGTEVRFDGQDFLVLKQDDILAVVETATA